MFTIKTFYKAHSDKSGLFLAKQNSKPLSYTKCLRLFLCTQRGLGKQVLQAKTHKYVPCLGLYKNYCFHTKKVES